MAKTSGGVRPVTANRSSAYVGRKREAAAMAESGLYSLVEFSQRGGGYVAVEKGRTIHKPEELQAAKILSDKGYKIILKDETGQMKTPDGYTFKYSYEQRTPGPKVTNRENNINKALEHARDKKSDVALIYDKNNVHDRNSVESGIKRYEAVNGYRFKKIIVVSSRGNIHVHKHND